MRKFNGSNPFQIILMSETLTIAVNYDQQRYKKFPLMREGRGGGMSIFLKNINEESRGCVKLIFVTCFCEYTFIGQFLFLRNLF